MNKTFEILENLLKKDERFVSREGKVMRNAVYEASNKMDEKLISLLMSDEKIRDIFFTKVNDIYVYDKQKFNFVINNRQMLPDSYTRYRQDIGLVNSKNDYISATNDVVLSFPFKDCVLEFDSTDPDQKREEVFYNEILAHDEIDHLFSPKVLANAKLVDKNDEKDVTIFSEDSNLLIKGNNLLAMYSLLPRYKGKIKLMYWDILYNTDSDHVPYADNFKHSSWLVMMKNRLEVAKQLLRDDGVICLQCDDNEMAYLKVLCDEIFDRESFISCFNIQVRYAEKSLNERSDFQPVNEYLLIYKKEKAAKIQPNKPYEEYTLDKFVFEIKEKTKGTEIGLVGGKRMTVFKENEYEIIKHEVGNIKLLKETWASGSVLKGNTSGKYFDKYISNRKSLDGLKCLYKVEGIGDDGIGFRYFTGPKKATATKGLFYAGVPMERKKEIESGKKSKKSFAITNNYDFSGEFGNCRGEGNVELVGGKKPEAYIDLIIELFSNSNDLIMDAYFGTGTTGAVAMKMGRKFIGIEQLDSHIELAKTRLKNVIDGDATGISKAVDWKGGGSFVYLELKKLNKQYAEDVKYAKSKKELVDIWNKIYDTGFISCFANKEIVNKMIDDPENIEIDDIKKVLIELLDKNQLYVNYEDMNDIDFKVSEEDKKFTESFYNVK